MARLSGATPCRREVGVDTGASRSRGRAEAAGKVRFRANRSIGECRQGGRLCELEIEPVTHRSRRSAHSPVARCPSSPRSLQPASSGPSPDRFPPLRTTGDRVKPTSLGGCDATRQALSSPDARRFRFSIARRAARVAVYREIELVKPTGRVRSRTGIEGSISVIFPWRECARSAAGPSGVLTFGRRHPRHGPDAVRNRKAERFAMEAGQLADAMLGSNSLGARTFSFASTGDSGVGRAKRGRRCSCQSRRSASSTDTGSQASSGSFLQRRRLVPSQESRLHPEGVGQKCEAHAFKDPSFGRLTLRDVEEFELRNETS